MADDSARDDGVAGGERTMDAIAQVTAARRRALLEHAREALFSTELDGTLLDANPAAAAALGIDVSLEHPEALLLCVAQADADCVRRVLETIAHTSSAEIELHLRTPAGRALWAVRAKFGREAHAVLWSAATNGEVEATGLRRRVLDTTELLDRERRRSAMSDAASEAKDRLLAIVAEDTSATLNSVLGWTRMLRQEVLDKTARDIALAVIEGNVERHLTLLSELLEVARIVDGDLAIDVERLEVGPLVDNALRTAAAAAADEGVTVRAAARRVDDDAAVLGDRGKLVRLVHAAIEGFVDQAERGDELSVATDLEDAAFVLRVSASRPSFSSSTDTPLLVAGTTPFVRPTSTFAFLLVGRIARMHGGSATQSSGSDGSCCLEIRLPLSLEVRVQAAPRAVQPLRGMRVLVFAPDSDIRELARLELRDHGASVLSARDVSTASAAVASFRPDVVVADMDQDGGRLLDELEAQFASASCAVVGLTSSTTMHAGKEEAGSRRSHVILPMPLARGRLVEAVERSRSTAVGSSAVPFSRGSSTEST
jgi:signal transduction histidine kinase